MNASPFASGLPASQSVEVRPCLPVGLLLALLAGGCAPSGDDPLSRLTTYAPPSGEYRLRYLEPPWELVSQRDTTAILRIPSNAMAAGIEAGPPKYELIATVEAGEPASRAAADETRARGRDLEILGGGPREFVTREGVVGVELSTRESLPAEARSRRVAYLPIDAARVLRLAFEATPPLDTEEVDVMLAHVGIGPEPG